MDEKREKVMVTLRLPDETREKVCEQELAKKAPALYTLCQDNSEEINLGKIQFLSTSAKFTSEVIKAVIHETHDVFIERTLSEECAILSIANYLGNEDWKLKLQERIARRARLELKKQDELKSLAEFAHATDSKRLLLAVGSRLVESGNISLLNPEVQNALEKMKQEILDNDILLTDMTGTISIRKKDTGEKIQCMNNYSFFVVSLVYSPDNNYIATASVDAKICIYSRFTGDLVYVFFHGDSISTLAFLTNTLLASVSDDKTCRVWDITRRVQLYILKHTFPVVALGVDLRSSFWLATACKDHSIHIWNTLSWSHTRDRPGHYKAITTLAVSHKAGYLASASLDTTVKLWSTNHDFECQYILRGHKDAVRALAWSPDGQVLLSASDDTTIQQWSPIFGTRIAIFENIHSDWIFSMKLSSDGVTVVTCGLDKYLCTFNRTNKQIIQKIKLEHTPYALALP